MTSSSPKPVLRGRFFRKGFQLETAACVFFLMLAVCTFFIWETTRQLSQQVKLSMDARAQVASMRRELHHSALTKELLSEFEDEVFTQALQERSEEIDTHYKEEMRDIADAQEALLRRQKQIFWIWTLGFGLMAALWVARRA